MTVKAKCDCCGKMFNVNDIKLLIFPEVEFDGAACQTCEDSLRKRVRHIKEGLNDE